MMRDLYRIECPSWRALHAKRATKKETAVLLDAYFSVPPKVPVGNRHQFSITRACISRLDPSWASAGIGTYESGEIKWFKRNGDRWVYQQRAPHAIVLSLASCGGFNAAEYGG